LPGNSFHIVELDVSRSLASSFPPLLSLLPFLLPPRAPFEKIAQFHPPYLSDLGQSHLHAPELALVAEAKLADELELGVQALLLERTARLLEGLAD
jgi:hypothetical protein